MDTEQFDVAIVGGGPAGLSAALVLGRSLRDVVLYDDGKPRNTSSYAARSVFTRDGIAPSELIEIGRRQLDPYPVKLVDETITGIRPAGSRFEITAASESRTSVRKVVLATGVVDMKPDIKGIGKFWGKSVVHCPYCHGWELRNKRIAALVDSESIYNFAQLLWGWSRDLVLLSNGPVDLGEEERRRIESRGIPIVTVPIAELTGSGGKLEEVQLENGRSLKVDAIFVHPEQKLHSALGRKLNLELENDHRIRADSYGETSVPGVYVAGDAGPNRQQINVAASSGTQVGITVNHKLLKEDFES